MSWFRFLTKMWAVWVVIVIFLVYYFFGPFKIRDGFLQARVFVNTLSPRFYVALTGTSSLISGLILIFEWWYFKRYGTSFIEQVSMNYLSPLVAGGNQQQQQQQQQQANGHARVGYHSNRTNNGGSGGGVFEDDDGAGLDDDLGYTDGANSGTGLNNGNGGESKLQRNPMALFRKAEYERFRYCTGREPLTLFDLNLSSQEYLAMFLLPSDVATDSRPDLQMMELAFRERDLPERVNKAHLALERNPDCIQAMALLAEEEVTTVVEAERYLRQALKLAESSFRRPQQTVVAMNEATEMAFRRDVMLLFWLKRRLGMCLRRLGRIREAIKIFKELLKDSCFSDLAENFGVHENLVEAMLEHQMYPDVGTTLSKYDGTFGETRSAAMCYTTALIKVRAVADKFSPEIATRRGLTPQEMSAIEAIHRAVEYNPHVPQYLLEMKKLILPPEHIVRRGDSEAVAYVFNHLVHWKRIEGSLSLLQCTYEGAFRVLPSPLESGYLFYSYPSNIEYTDRELLPAFHEVSVYPKKELPFFILFTAALCSVMALMTLLAHSYPQHTIALSRTIAHWMSAPFAFVISKLEAIIPSASSFALSKFA